MTPLILLPIGLAVFGLAAGYVVWICLGGRREPSATEDQ